MSDDTAPVRRVLIAHPSPDVYGSDLQLVETVRALRDSGAVVTVVLPSTGPLTRLLLAAGAGIRIAPFPVLRKAALRPVGLVRLTAETASGWKRLRRIVKQVSPDVVLVNTVTPPLWLAVARSLGVPTVCHVHEAETDGRRLVRRALYAPLGLADRVVTNSDSATRALLDVAPDLTGRTTRIYNGVPDPRRDGTTAASDPLVVFVGRLSPRKGPDVLLEAAARLRRRGRPVRVLLMGDTFRGYAWYEQELRMRAAVSDLAGAVTFAGYVAQPFAELPDTAIVVVPSRTEPFGNVAVEASLAGLPVIASDIQGLAEIVRHDDTGILFPPDDHEALADAIGALLDDPERTARLALGGYRRARAEFGVERYRRDIATEVLDAAQLVSS